MCYARWSTEKEVIGALRKFDIKKENDYSGIPLILNGNEAYVNREAHSLIIGSTGSGKTQVSILPSIRTAMLANESMLVNDPKAEIYHMTAGMLKENGYQIYAIDMDDSSLGNSYNPFDLPYSLYKNGNKDKAVKTLEDIAYYIFNDDKQEDFWISCSSDYFVGLALYLFENAKKEEINFNSVYKLAIYLNDELNLKSFKKNLDLSSVVYFKLSATIDAPNETRGGIASTFTQKIMKIVSRENLSNMLSSSDFDITNICQDKVAIFIVSGTNDFSSNLVPMLVNQIFDAAFIFGKNDKMFNLLLDEFDNMMPIKDFSTIINMSRGLGIRFTVLIKGYAELKMRYGIDNFEIIKMCFSNIIYLLSNDMETVSEVSKLCGKTKNGENLIGIEELKHMKMFEAIVLLPRLYPFKTKLMPDYLIDWGYEKTTIDLPKRKIKDLKTFIME